MKYVVAICIVVGTAFCLRCVIDEGNMTTHDYTGWGIVKDSPIR